jgi:hypothetical protein
MKRRTYMRAMLAGAAPLLVKGAGPAGIQLHVDMSVDPSKEEAMMKHYREVFLPTIKKQEGFIDLKMVKLRSTPMGKGPEGINWRFVLNFKSEELRQKWVNSPVHQKVWPPMEAMMRNSKNYTVMIFDVQE